MDADLSAYCAIMLPYRFALESTSDGLNQLYNVDENSIHTDAKSNRSTQTDSAGKRYGILADQFTF